MRIFTCITFLAGFFPFLPSLLTYLLPSFLILFLSFLFCFLSFLFFPFHSFFFIVCLLPSIPLSLFLISVPRSPLEVTVLPEDLWPSYCDPLYEMPSSIDVKVTLEQGTLDQGDYTFQVAIIKAVIGSKAYLGKTLLFFFLFFFPFFLFLLFL